MAKFFQNINLFVLFSYLFTAVEATLLNPSSGALNVPHCKILFCYYCNTFWDDTFSLGQIHVRLRQTTRSHDASQHLINISDCVKEASRQLFCVRKVTTLIFTGEEIKARGKDSAFRSYWCKTVNNVECLKPGAYFRKKNSDKSRQRYKSKAEIGKDTVYWSCVRLRH